MKDQRNKSIRRIRHLADFIGKKPAYLASAGVLHGRVYLKRDPVDSGHWMRWQDNTARYFTVLRGDYSNAELDYQCKCHFGTEYRFRFKLEDRRNDGFTHKIDGVGTAMTPGGRKSNSGTSQLQRLGQGAITMIKVTGPLMYEVSAGECTVQVRLEAKPQDREIMGPTTYIVKSSVKRSAAKRTNNNLHKLSPRGDSL